MPVPSILRTARVCRSAIRLDLGISPGQASKAGPYLHCDRAKRQHDPSAQTNKKKKREKKDGNEFFPRLFEYLGLILAASIPHTGASRKLKEGVMDWKYRGFRVRDGQFQGWILVCQRRERHGQWTHPPAFQAGPMQGQGADRGKVERQQVAASEMVLPQLFRTIIRPSMREG